MTSIKYWLAPFGCVFLLSGCGDSVESLAEDDARRHGLLKECSEMGLKAIDSDECKMAAEAEAVALRKGAEELLGDVKESLEGTTSSEPEAAPTEDSSASEAVEPTPEPTTEPEEGATAEPEGSDDAGAEPGETDDSATSIEDKVMEEVEDAVKENMPSESLY